MKYFCSSDIAYLNDVNTRGIQPFGADGKPNGTQQWVEIIKHPQREEWAACIPDDFLPRLADVLSPAELDVVGAVLKTHDNMIADGWFVNI